MRLTSKKILALFFLLVPLAGVYWLTEYPLQKEVETRVARLLAEQGYTDVEVKVGGLSQQHVLFSHLRLKKDKLDITADDLLITATNLPYRELLKRRYDNVTADWSVKALGVAGIGYDLPALSGAGSFRMDKSSPMVTGALADDKKETGAAFTVTPERALIEKLRTAAYGARIASERIVISLKEKQPIHIPLAVEGLNLATLLDMMLGGKASGTGTVSGRVDLVIYPDGRFDIGKGGMGAQGDGYIRLQPSALPGDRPQLEQARLALSNFHYKDLSITSSRDAAGKTVIMLNLEGNNPEAFDGRAIKLNVNLTGDVLQLLQQSLMPITDPASFIQKESK